MNDVPASSAQKVHFWTLNAVSDRIRRRVNRFAKLDDVERIAVMPDVHLSQRYCIGTVVATRDWIYPDAIGSDVGCGMSTVRLTRINADWICRDEWPEMLQMLKRDVPALKRQTPTSLSIRPELAELSHRSLTNLSERIGRYQLGTLGRGNHFLEFQVDDQNRLWILVHSGSRGMGQAITKRHLQQCQRRLGWLALPADSSAGRAYLQDIAWARVYAQQNRLTILNTVVHRLRKRWSERFEIDDAIDSDHNHVQQEETGFGLRWVHRKGAQSARLGEHGVIPGSMATATYHVVGRGCQESLQSSSHGAGRRLSRTEAARRISTRQLRRQMGHVLYDRGNGGGLRDESPSAYKDIHKVVAAQRSLVRVTRRLRPVANYKAVG